MFFSEFRRCSPVQINGEEGPFVAAKRQALLPVERAILHPNHRLPAVLQKGLLKSHRNGRVHFQGKKGSKSALAKCFVKKTVCATHYSIIVGESSNLRQ